MKTKKTKNKPAKKTADWDKFPRIRAVERTNKAGATCYYYTVDKGLIDGKRTIKTFKSIGDAKKEAQSVRNKSKQIGEKAARTHDSKVWRDAMAALDKLENRATLLQAAEFYTAHHPDKGKVKTVMDVYEEFLAEKRDKKKVKQATLYDIQSKYKSFAKMFENKLIHEITKTDIEKWLNKKKLSDYSKHKHLKKINTMFRWAAHIDRRYISTELNPCSGVILPDLERKPPATLPYKKVVELLKYVGNHKTRKQMLPWYALAFFAGLRPNSELARLNWENVKFKKRKIEVMSSKMEWHPVNMEDNLLEWLAPYLKKRPKGTIFYSADMFREINKHLKIKWVQDYTRHTYATNWYAHFPKLKENKGHQPVDMLYANMGHEDPTTTYRKYVKKAIEPEDAAAYWQITPDILDNVTKISEARKLA